MKEKDDKEHGDKENGKEEVRQKFNSRIMRKEKERENGKMGLEEIQMNDKRRKLGS